jgi:hypothetical protein
MLHIPQTPRHLIITFSHRWTIKRNRKFRKREALERELNKFFVSKYHEFYRSGIYKRIARWEKIIDCDDYFLNKTFVFIF